jgi:RNA 3'-terminal phosphate cyclase (ATP)
MIEIDGSFGEGGGQILRTSLALALLTRQAFHLRNVRARRPKPGLRAQHLMSVRAATAIGQAIAHGDFLGSSEVVFEPGNVAPGGYDFDIGTAGGTGLVLHTLYLPLAWRTGLPSTITLRGGTHVKASPCFHFLDTTWRLYLDLLGLYIGIQMFRPGFYPRGGGTMQAHVQPCAGLQGLQWVDFQPPTSVVVTSAVANLPENIATRQARHATHYLRQLGLKVESREERWGSGLGTVVMAALDTKPVPTLYFSLGARGKPAEQVADELVGQVKQHVHSKPLGIDLHSADQILQPLVFAQQPSRFRVTEVTSHLLTNITVIRRFVDRSIHCDAPEGAPGMISVD